jgi:hypothetical protein
MPTNTFILFYIDLMRSIEERGQLNKLDLIEAWKQRRRLRLRWSVDASQMATARLGLRR